MTDTRFFYLFFSVMKWRKSRSPKTWMMLKLWEQYCLNTKTPTTPRCWWPTLQHMFCILGENITLYVKYVLYYLLWTTLLRFRLSKAVWFALIVCTSYSVNFVLPEVIILLSFSGYSFISFLWLNPSAGIPDKVWPCMNLQNCQWYLPHVKLIIRKNLSHSFRVSALSLL